MLMPNRQTKSAYGYRYEYQGQEKDPETGKEAFELRLWDGRIGRWLSPDPKGQYFSPYMGMGNNPINGVDPDGGCFQEIEGKMVPCADGVIGSTQIGVYGNEWIMTEENGWQLNNGIDSTSVVYNYEEIAPDGSADYYVNRYKNHIGKYGTRPPDYYLGYGYNNNKLFDASSVAKDEKGKIWVDKVGIELQKLMNNEIKKNPQIQGNHSNFLDMAYETHVPAYTVDSYILELSHRNNLLLKIMFVPEINHTFLSIRGVKQINLMIIYFASHDPMRRYEDSNIGGFKVYQMKD